MFHRQANPNRTFSSSIMCKKIAYWSKMSSLILSNWQISKIITMIENSPRSAKSRQLTEFRPVAVISLRTSPRSSNSSPSHHTNKKAMPTPPTKRECLRGQRPACLPRQRLLTGPTSSSTSKTSRFFRQCPTRPTNSTRFGRAGRCRFSWRKRARETPSITASRCPSTT